jgi:hypothetical protein
MSKLRVLLLSVLLPLLAAAGDTAKPTIYIEPQEGFEVYLAAAMGKKEVPVEVVTQQASATYLLKSSAIIAKKESTGSKVTRCLFLYCAGIEDQGSVSVQLIESNSSKVLWAYSVNKQRGQKNTQSMAEAIAKHLKAFFEHK